MKPTNLLFDDEGHLRVADFGLGRAIAEAAAIQPVGAVLGTARYASPEQVDGGPLDGRSDVYSLALVLVEAITGEVPFAADTPAARLSRPLEPPEAVGPLAEALAAAGAVSAASRTDAATFGRMLKAAATGLARPDPFPLHAPHPEAGLAAERIAASPAAPAAPAAPPAPDDVIVTSGLRKVYPPDRVAVEGLDLCVRRGEIFGLLGPNGAGKSTTVGMLTTRVIPTSGSAIVNGIDVVAHPARAKQAIGVVSQANTLDQGLNVWENLYFHGRYFGLGDRVSRSAADELLERFRLADRKLSHVESLSGGMARRLMVARALLHRPSVIFLDEPTAGLDPQSRIALWEVLVELQGEGQTVLVTTHHMDEADEHCDRVAIVDHGRILAVDTPRGLKASKGSGASVTVRAEDDLEALALHLGRVDGATEVRVVEGEVRLNLPTCEGAMQRILVAAQGGGFQLTDLSVSDDSLETVFVNLTGKDLRD